MAWPVIGKAFTPAEFAEYVKGLRWGDAFRPRFIALHNTASPSLAQRPDGLTHQHILNLQAYYQSLGWGGGPHLFVDDKQIWVFNDPTKRGVHSPSWNGTALGIEMLGDFGCESFTSGRGRKVRDNVIAAVAAFNNALGFPANGFKWHVEDTKSDHDCPGKLARNERAPLIAEIQAAMDRLKAPPAPAVVAVHDDDIDTKAVDLSRAESLAATPKPESITSKAAGLFGSYSFAQLNDLADQGSRLADKLRSFKRWLWSTVFTVGTGVSVVDTNKGSANVFTNMVAEHPFLFVGVVGVIFAVAVYIAIKLAEKYLVTAARDGRYSPRGG